MEGHEYLSHLSLLERHGAQLIVFLARLAGILTRSVLEEASKDVGDRGRVLVEGASEDDRPSEVSLRERSAMLVDDGSMSGEVGNGGEGRGVKGQWDCKVGVMERDERNTHRPRVTVYSVGSSYNGKSSWIVSIILPRSRLQISSNYNGYSSHNH